MPPWTWMVSDAIRCSAAELSAWSDARRQYRVVQAIGGAHAAW